MTVSLRSRSFLDFFAPCSLSAEQQPTVSPIRGQASTPTSSGASIGIKFSNTVLRMVAYSPKNFLLAGKE